MNTTTPKNWTCISLVEAGDLIMGQSPSGSSYNSVGNGSPLLNGAAELRINGIDVKKYTTSPTRMSEAGDLLFCIRATIGNLNLSDKEYCLGRGVAALRVNNKYSKKYISLQLEALFDQMRKMSQGGVIKGLKKEEIGEFEFLIPLDKLKQEKIADIILSVENMISETQKMIDRSEKLKKSLMPRLFTKGIGHTKFKQTEMGEVPESWNIETLGEMTNFIDYRGKTPKKTKSGIPLITAKNVRFGHIVDEPKEYIAESDYNSWMTRGIPKKGDVLFTTEAPLGNVAQIQTSDRVAFAQRIIVIQPNIGLNEHFLMYQLLSPRVQKIIHSYGTGGTVTGIKAKTLRSIHIAVAPISEQIKIAETLRSIDQQIKLNKTLKAIQEQLKQGLMQDLLTGKVAV